MSTKNINQQRNEINDANKLKTNDFNAKEMIIKSNQLDN